MTPHGHATDRLAELERHNAALERRLAALEARDPFVGPIEQVWIAKTYSSSPEGYPSPPANCFDIRFIRPKLDVYSPGTRTATLTPRSADAQAVACAYDGRYLPRDTLCEVARIGKRWWIIGAAGLEHFGRLKTSLTKGSTADVDLLTWNGTKLLDTGKDLLGVQEIFCNSGDTYEAKTKVLLRLWVPDQYFIVNAWCTADDTEDSEYEEEEE